MLFYKELAIGYTHYWRRAEVLDAGLFAKASKDCKKICDYFNDFDLVNGQGKKGTKPNFSKDSIIFNGVEDDGHETFYIQQKFQDRYGSGADEDGRH